METVGSCRLYPVVRIGWQGAQPCESCSKFRAQWWGPPVSQLCDLGQSLHFSCCVFHGKLQGMGLQGHGARGQFSGWHLPCPQGQDAGTYTCTAENAVGRAHHRVHLTILSLPVFTTLPGDRSLRLGDRLWLRCAARGSPTPRLGWTINDQPVTGLSGAGGTGPGPWGWRGVGRAPRPT